MHQAPPRPVPRSRTPLCLRHVEFTISTSFALRNLAYQQLTHSFLPFAFTFVFLQVPPGVLYHTKYRCWINSPVCNKGTFIWGPGILWKPVRGHLSTSLCPGGFGSHSVEHAVGGEESENPDILAVACTPVPHHPFRELVNWASAAFAKATVKPGSLLSCVHS